MQHCKITKFKKEKNTGGMKTKKIHAKLSIYLIQITLKKRIISDTMRRYSQIFSPNNEVQQIQSLLGLESDTSVSRNLYFCQEKT